MAARFQIAAQLAEVVDLSVEDDLNGVVLVADWLAAAFQVDDRKATMDEPDVSCWCGSRVAAGELLAGVLGSLGIGASMRDGTRHARQHVRVDSANRIGIGDASDAAHGDAPGNANSVHSEIRACDRVPLASPVKGSHIAESTGRASGTRHRTSFRAEPAVLNIPPGPDQAGRSAENGWPFTAISAVTACQSGGSGLSGRAGMTGKTANRLL